jgi:hypothetical protein
MGPGEFADERSWCDAEFICLSEGVPNVSGAGSGLTGKARRGKALAARVRICSRCRATQPEQRRQRRD